MYIIRNFNNVYNSPQLDIHIIYKYIPTKSHKIYFFIRVYYTKHTLYYVRSEKTLNKARSPNCKYWPIEHWLREFSGYSRIFRTEHDRRHYRLIIVTRSLQDNEHKRSREIANFPLHFPKRPTENSRCSNGDDSDEIFQILPNLHGY